MEPITASRTAFLVVHLQNDIADEAGKFGGFFIDEIRRNDTLGKAAALLDAARSAGAHVVYTRVGFASDYRDLVPNSPLLGMVAQFGALVNGTWQTEIVPQVAPAEGEVVLTHTRVGGFHGSPLNEILRGKGVDTVVVLGVATNASVEDTARGAANRGFRTIIASDASSAAHEGAHRATLETFGLLGETATNEQLVAALVG